MKKLKQIVPAPIPGAVPVVTKLVPLMPGKLAGFGDEKTDEVSHEPSGARQPEDSSRRQHTKARRKEKNDGGWVENRPAKPAAAKVVRKDK